MSPISVPHHSSRRLLVLVVFLFTRSSLSTNSFDDRRDACHDGLQVRGPGWHQADLILPSRYFFVHVPHGCDKKSVTVQIQSLTGPKDCQIRTQILRPILMDFMIVRYRILSPFCPNGISIRLSDTINGRLIAQKDIAAVIRSEECSCPHEDFSQQMGCSADLKSSRIEQDLSVFRNELPSNFSVWLSDGISRFASYPRSYSFCHYKIVSNEVYRKCYGEYVGFSMFFDAFVTSLVRKAYLPDTEFLVNLGDWPLSSRKPSLRPIPIFSWCGSTDTYDLVLPTYEMTESVLQSQARVSVDMMAVMGHQGTPFHQKISKAFFRGRDSNRIRLLLVLYSKRTPDLIDAAITNFFFFREEDEVRKYGPTVKHISLFDFFEYKYLVSIDGTVAAYRLPNLLSSSSLVLKQSSKYYEHFYHFLKPGQHFIELKDDLIDLYQVMDRLTNASATDFIPPVAQMQIVEQANRLMLDHVMPINIYCHYFNLITEYSKLLPHGPVAVNDDDDHVLTGNQECDCRATISTPVKEEL